MSRNNHRATISSLIKKDLEKAYFLAAYPSSYSPKSRFYNDKKYQVFDYPPEESSDPLYLFRFLPTVGDEVPVLMVQDPPVYLIQHWEMWLPSFPKADLRKLDEGLNDDVPIVTLGAMQDLRVEQHSVHPDVLYKLHLKSTILDIGVPCPRHMNEDTVTFPCMVKVDMSLGGLGNRVARNKDELSKVLSEIREKRGWNGSLVFQELVSGIKDVPNSVFYLHKSGQISWIGTSIGGFDGFSFTTAFVDWDRQQEYKDLLHDQFTVPLCKYLHKQGYFGLVNYEVLRTDHGMYLVDMNPRQSADTSHLLIAPYMAQLGFKHSIFYQREITNDISAEAFVEKANKMNRESKTGKIIILSVVDVDTKKCKSYFSVYAQSLDEANAILSQQLACSSVEDHKAIMEMNHTYHVSNKIENGELKLDEPVF